MLLRPSSPVDMKIRRTPRPGATESSEMVVAEVEFAVNCRITLSFLSFPCRVICNLFEFEAGFSFSVNETSFSANIC